MERGIDPESRRLVGRLRKLAGSIFNWIDTTVEPQIYKPSARIDVGKSERAARGVQLVVKPITEYGGQLHLEESQIPDDIA